MKLRRSRLTALATAAVLCVTMSGAVYAGTTASNTTAAVSSTDEKSEKYQCVIFWDSTNGSDKADGSEGKPVKTLKKAVELLKKAAASDTGSAAIVSSNVLSEADKKLASEQKVNVIGVSEYEKQDETVSKDETNDSSSEPETQENTDKESTDKENTDKENADKENTEKEDTDKDSSDKDDSDQNTTDKVDTETSDKDSDAEVTPSKPDTNTETQQNTDTQNDDQGNNEQPNAEQNNEVQDNVQKKNDQTDAEQNSEAQDKDQTAPEQNSEVQNTEQPASQQKAPTPTQDNSTANNAVAFSLVNEENTVDITPEAAESNAVVPETAAVNEIDPVEEQDTLTADAVPQTVITPRPESTDNSEETDDNISLYRLPGTDIVGTGTTNTGSSSSNSSNGQTSTVTKPDTSGSSDTPSQTDTQVTPSPDTGNTTSATKTAESVNTRDEKTVLLSLITCIVLSIAALFVYKRINVEKKRSLIREAHERSMEEFRKSCRRD